MWTDYLSSYDGVERLGLIIYMFRISIQ